MFSSWGIFPAQGLNWGLTCISRRMLFCLCYQRARQSGGEQRLGNPTRQHTVTAELSMLKERHGAHGELERR